MSQGKDDAQGLKPELLGARAARAQTADLAESRIQATTLSVSAFLPPSSLPSTSPRSLAPMPLCQTRSLAIFVRFFGIGGAFSDPLKERARSRAGIGNGDAIILDITVCLPPFEKPKCLRLNVQIMEPHRKSYHHAMQETKHKRKLLTDDDDDDGSCDKKKR